LEKKKFQSSRRNPLPDYRNKGGDALPKKKGQNHWESLSEGEGGRLPTAQRQEGGNGRKGGV